MKKELLSPEYWKWLAVINGQSFRNFSSVICPKEVKQAKLLKTKKGKPE
jgi:hypothetical protein